MTGKRAAARVRRLINELLRHRTSFGTRWSTEVGVTVALKALPPRS